MNQVMSLEHCNIELLSVIIDALDVPVPKLDWASEPECARSRPSQQQ
jgi:hypothetical protein